VRTDRCNIKFLLGFLARRNPSVSIESPVMVRLSVTPVDIRSVLCCVVLCAVAIMRFNGVYKLERCWLLASGL
jgi:hypothetical protein